MATALVDPAEGSDRRRSRPLSRRSSKRANNKQRRSDELLRFFFDDGERNLTSVNDTLNSTLLVDEEEEINYCPKDKVLDLMDQLGLEDNCFVPRRVQSRPPPGDRRRCSRRAGRVCWSLVARGKSHDRLGFLANKLLKDVVCFAHEGHLCLPLGTEKLVWLPAGRRSAKEFLREHCTAAQLCNLPDSVLGRCNELHVLKAWVSEGITPRQIPVVKEKHEKIVRKSRAVSCKSEGRQKAVSAKFELKESLALQNGLDSVFVTLQHREITPEDYELLLRLDASVAPKTFSNDVLKELKAVELADDNVCIFADSCSICMETFALRDSIKVLPCQHHFHAACIDMWLSTASQLCPLDGLPAL